MRAYRDVLRTPGLRVPFLATVIGALPLGILSLGLLLHARRLTGSFAAGGAAAAAFGLGNALGLGLQGRLIDRYGQARVLLPAGAACALWGVLLATAVPAAGAPLLTVPAAAAMGLCVPATTGGMRVLLAERVAEAEARAAGYALLAVLFQLAVLSGPPAASALLAVAGPGAAVVAGGLLACLAAALFAGSSASREWRPAPAGGLHAGLHAGLPGGAGLRVLLAVTAGTGVAAGAVAVAVPAAALAHGGGASSGLLIGTSAAGEVAAGLAYGAMPARWAVPSLVLPAALAGYAAAVGLAAWAAAGLAPLFPALFLVGACTGPSSIAASALLDTLVPRAALTRAYTLMVSVFLLGGAAGSAAAGALTEGLGHRTCLALAACWLAALFVAAFRHRAALGAGHTPRQPERPRVEPSGTPQA